MKRILSSSSHISTRMKVVLLLWLVAFGLVLAQEELSVETPEAFTDAMFNLIGIDVIACPDSWQADIDNGMQCGTFGGTVSNFQILWDSYASVPASPVTTARDWRVFDAGELKTMYFGELGYTVYVQDLDGARFVAIMYSNPQGSLDIGQHRQLAFKVIHDVGAEVVECDTLDTNLICARIEGELSIIVEEIDFSILGVPTVSAPDAVWRDMGTDYYDAALRKYTYFDGIHYVFLTQPTRNSTFDIVWTISP